MNNHGPDRYDVSIAFQTWQTCFVRAAATPTGISNNEDAWKTGTETALEYLARGRFTEVMARFCDGMVSGAARASVLGMELVRGDVPELLEQLVQLDQKAGAKLQEVVQRFVTDGTARQEVARVPEMSLAHRIWFANGSPPALDPPAPAVRLSGRDRRAAALVVAHAEPPPPPKGTVKPAAPPVPLDPPRTSPGLKGAARRAAVLADLQAAQAAPEAPPAPIPAAQVSATEAPQDPPPEAA